MTKREAWALLELMITMTPEDRRVALARLAPPAVRTIIEEWFWRAHEGQMEPKGDWLIWLLMAGATSARRGPGRNGCGRGRARPRTRASPWSAARSRRSPR